MPLFLKPDLKKTIVFIALVGIALFVDVIAEILGDIKAGTVLFFIFIWPFFPHTVDQTFPAGNYAALSYTLEIVYLYILACILIWVYKKYEKKILGRILKIIFIIVILIGFIAAYFLYLAARPSSPHYPDARIEVTMNQLRSSAEIYSLSYGGVYNGGPTSMEDVCSASSCTTYSAGSPERDICTLCQEIDVQNGANGGVPTFQASSNEYCAYVSLATSSTKYFCIDEGRVIETTTNPSIQDCTPSSFNCPLK